MRVSHFHALGGNSPFLSRPVYFVLPRFDKLPGSHEGQSQEPHSRSGQAVALIGFHGFQQRRKLGGRDASLALYRNMTNNVAQVARRIVFDNPAPDGISENLLNELLNDMGGFVNTFAVDCFNAVNQFDGFNFPDGAKAHAWKSMKLKLTQVSFYGCCFRRFFNRHPAPRHGFKGIFASLGPLLFGDALVLSRVYAAQQKLFNVISNFAGFCGPNQRVCANRIFLFLVLIAVFDFPQLAPRWHDQKKHPIAVEKLVGPFFWLRVADFGV